MKKTLLILLILSVMFLGLPGCQPQLPQADIAATTLPIYEFTQRLCQGTELAVVRLVTENISCLHDYSLNVRQVRVLEEVNCVVISGAGLEDFMENLLSGKQVIDSSQGISLLEYTHHHEEQHHQPHHGEDAHIWLSISNAKSMAETICRGLQSQYPQHSSCFAENLHLLLQDMDKLQAYAQASLANLTQREIITFHDGFAYLAESFGLEIIEAIEEESGSEASAKELIHLIELVKNHNLKAVFTEVGGSVAAAKVLSAETGCGVYPLDMAMSGDSWFSAMYHNIHTLKEALE